MTSPTTGVEQTAQEVLQTAQETEAAQEALELEFSEKLTVATTKDEVVALWKDYYGRLGHRRLGRLLVGTAKKR